MTAPDLTLDVHYEQLLAVVYDTKATDAARVKAALYCLNVLRAEFARIKRDAT